MAWECLEVARKIYESQQNGSVGSVSSISSSSAAASFSSNSSSQLDENLAEVYCRLGDLQKFNGNFPEVIMLIV